MPYLFFELAWYVLAAFLFGLAVGWFTCVERENDGV